MTFPLTTAVDAVITRVLLMEASAIVALTPSSVNEVKDWIHWEQQTPYFTNRISRLAETEADSGRYDLGITMRLIIAHIATVKTDYSDGETPQAKAWTYIPEILQYFETYHQLDPLGQAEVQYLDPIGLTISCNTGTDEVSLPGQTNTSLKADFELTIPLLIMSQRGG